LHQGGFSLYDFLHGVLGFFVSAKCWKGRSCRFT